MLEHNQEKHQKIEQKKLNQTLQQFCSNPTVSNELIAQALKKGANSNYQNENGDTALHLAARNPNADGITIALLIENKADINILNGKNETLEINKPYLTFQVLELVFTKNPNIIDIKNFLEKNKGNVEINIKYFDGRTCLHYACIIGDTQLVELLLANKADPNAKDKFSNTPLYYACLVESLNQVIIKILLNNKSNPNIRGHNGNTPLHILCKHEKTSIEVLKLFKEYNADFKLIDNRNNNSWGIILDNDCAKDEIIEWLEKESGQKETNGTLKLLMNLSEEISRKNKRKLNEKEFNQLKIEEPSRLYIDLLDNLKKNAEIRIFNNNLNEINDESIKNSACFCLLSEASKITFVNIDYIKLLLNLLPLNFVNGNRQTILHILCENFSLNTNVAVFKAVLEKTDCNHLDKTGLSPFFYACANQHMTVEIIELLIKKDANLGIKFKNAKFQFAWVIAKQNQLNSTIIDYLEWASCNLILINQNNPDIIPVLESLVYEGLNINRKYKNDNTLLHFVCSRPITNRNLIESLIKYGANPSIKNSNDYTPLQLIEHCLKLTQQKINVRDENSIHQYQKTYQSLQEIYQLMPKNIKLPSNPVNFSYKNTGQQFTHFNNTQNHTVPIESVQFKVPQGYNFKNTN